MSESRWRWTRNEWVALRYLRLLASHNAGYQLRGVRGWAHLNDLEDDPGGRFFEVLPRLHARGLLDRADVRAPGQVRPVWVYRISQRGVSVVDEAAPKAHKPIPPPRTADTSGAAYAPSRQRGALLLLREAHDDPTMEEQFGGRGWISGRELGARVDVHNFKQRRRRQPMLAVDGTDLRWLVQWGLAERRNDPERAGSVYWRATAVGMAVRLVEWKTLRAVD
jgi:hypothetical protein